MRCYRCGRGEMVTQHVRFNLETDDALVLVSNVPARVCPQCGERVFSLDVMRQLEQIRDEIRRGQLKTRPAGEDVRQLVFAGR